MLSSRREVALARPLSTASLPVTSRWLSHLGRLAKLCSTCDATERALPLPGVAVVWWLAWPPRDLFLHRPWFSRDSCWGSHRQTPQAPGTPTVPQSLPVAPRTVAVSV